MRKIFLIFNYLIGVIGIRSEDIIITSFPKSGNTWVRFFLCNIISLREWGGETVTFPKLDATMPELGVSNLLMSWPHDTIPRVVKTHKPRWPIFRGNRVILLVRDPRDVMVSYYHFETGKRNGQFSGSFSEFIRHPKFGVEAWCRHYASWRTQATVVLTYAELKKDDVETFDRMLETIGVSLSRTLIRQAAERSRFEKIQEVEEKEGVRENSDHFEEGEQFTRKGETGQWDEYFNTTDLYYTRSLIEEYEIDIYNLSEL